MQELHAREAELPDTDEQFADELKDLIDELAISDQVNSSDYKAYKEEVNRAIATTLQNLRRIQQQRAVEAKANTFTGRC